jgi:cytoskeletal protein RodZ
MSLTLGEKLRQARESRGISISEVAEHTRISALYLESIENNDYRALPGGIFNKGFVKSYAKYLGLNDQEALQDYAALITEQGSDANDDPKTYRPQVLTDERSRSGLLPTAIFSIIIVGLIVWGIMAFLQYFQYSQNQPVADANAFPRLRPLPMKSKSSLKRCATASL